MHFARGAKKPAASLREEQGMLEEGSPSRVAGIVIAVLVVASGAPLLDRGIVPLDEGQVASFAVRILHGDVIYRDFYTGIYPGIYYLTALLFGLFGVDLLVMRVAALAVNLLTALCLWRLGLRALTPGRALVAPVLHTVLVVWSFPVMTMLAYSAVSLLFALGALLAAFRYVEKERTLDGVLVGLLLAACALTKQNYGLLAGLAVLFALIDGRRGGALRALRPVVVAGAIASGVAFALLAVSGAWPRFWQYTVATLAGSQLQAFDQPIPPIFGAHPADDGRFIFLYTPGVLFSYLIRGETLLGFPISPLLRSAVVRIAYGGVLVLLALAPLVLYATREGASLEARRAARTLYVASGLVFLGMFPSAIWSHLVAVMPPLLLLGVIVASRVYDAAARAAQAQRLRWLARSMAIATGALAIVVTLATLRVIADFSRWHDTPLDLDRASLHVSPDDAALLEGAVGYLERCAAPGEPIFVAPDLPLVYFLTDRPNPTPYEMHIPGDVDSDLLIERLEASRTRCALYNPKMYVHFEPLEKVFPAIPAYLAAEFETAEKIHAGGREWLGLVRKPDRES
jgi:hypothetical protein